MVLTLAIAGDIFGSQGISSEPQRDKPPDAMFSHDRIKSAELFGVGSGWLGGRLSTAEATPLFQPQLRSSQLRQASSASGIPSHLSQSRDPSPDGRHLTHNKLPSASPLWSAPGQSRDRKSNMFSQSPRLVGRRSTCCFDSQCCDAMASLSRGISYS